MSLRNINIDDFGYEIELTIVQDGVAQPIDSYATLEYIFVSPSNISTTKTAAFKTNGLNGVLTYTVDEDFIVEAGMWHVSARVSKSGERLTSEKLSFWVKA